MKTILFRLLAVLLLALPLRAQTIVTKTLDVGSGGTTGQYNSQAIVNGNPAIASRETKPIPFSEIGAKATADYKGDAIGITATAEGARLHTAFQKLSGTVTRQGLTLDSTSDKAGRLHLIASAIGRESSPLTPLPRTGKVKFGSEPSSSQPSTLNSQPPSTVTFTRPGLTEEYSVSVDGVRQDFIVAERPAGAGALLVELALRGATAETAAYGAKLTLDATGRELAYGRLRVSDATGRELAARLEVPATDRLRVVVEDAGAVYPVRIDPTFSDADWVSLNPGMPGANNPVSAAVVDGSGNLYIGGSFTFVGTVAANRVAKWNGSAWSALGSGMDNGVSALAVSGSDLYAGGQFITAGGTTVNRIAKWNGTAWSALGTGMSGYVYALAVSGSDLYAGGQFTTASGATVNRIAKWNGSAWSALGTGMNNAVQALAVSGSDLYAGGDFTTAGGTSANYIAKWNGSAWSALGTGMSGYVYALAVSGSDLYAGGQFTTASGATVNRIAKWNGSAWSALGTGMNNAVQALAVSGSDLYAGGNFTTAGGVANTNRIAKWNGSAWSALGTGMNRSVEALAVSGSDLYAGGYFTTAGGTSASRIAQWNGSAWSAFGTGMNRDVNALAVSGSDLYAGGDFTSAGGTTANYIAKWNGSAWSALGSGMNSSVQALAVSGSDLYAGGNFTTAGGTTANYIAKWNGSAWSALGTGIDGAVYALAVSGSNLYAGGDFTTAGGTTANYIAKWNGSAWSALGTGMDNAVQALAVSGSDLYAGGAFTTAFGTTANRIAKWNGSAWSALGTGMDSNVYALAADSTGHLYLGGAFTFAGTTLSPFIAQANLPTPEIAIEQPAGVGNNIASGGSRDFGAVALGSSADLVFTLLNTGTADLTLSGTPKVAVSGSGDFTVTAQPASPVAGPSGSTTFTVHFAPTSAGPLAASLSIANNDLDENPFTIALTGTGVFPVPTVAAISPNSGSTAGGTSVTITGTGLTGATGVTIGGVAVTSFTVVNGTTITAITPAGPPASGSVVVTTPGGSNGVNSLYTYVVPIITSVIVSDSFNRADQVLRGTVPAICSISPVPVYEIEGASGGFWQNVAISGNRVFLDTDVGLSVAISSTGSYTKPSVLRISATLNLGTIGDSGDSLARGLALGYYTGFTVDPSPIGIHGYDNGARGLVLELSGKITLTMVAGLDSGLSIPYASALFAGAPFDPGVSHTLSYQIDTISGDVSDVRLDGVQVGSFAAAGFTDANTPRAGFWISSTFGSRSGFVDDFQVEGLAPALPPTVTVSTANLLTTATSLTITGTNFSTMPGNNTVVFTPAGSGTVTAATATSLTVTSLSGHAPGALNAVVTSNGLSSGAPVQVATVTLAPQSITFPEIANKAGTDGTFALGATASSGLAVSYAVVSSGGVATVAGNMVTLTGVAGSVTIVATQAGNGSYDPAPAVYRTFVVRTTPAFVQIARGSLARHIVGIRADGTLWAWGSNSSGQLGDGSTTQRNSPVQVGVGANWQSVAVGQYHTVAVKSDGTLWAWGYNFDGQLGDGTTTQRTSPVQVGVGTNWQSVAAGYDHTAAVKSDGTLWAWGWNAFGQLGDGSTTQRTSPVQVGAGTNWQSVAAGYGHTVAVKSDGTLWAWGSNGSGQLGDGSTTQRTSPVQVGVGTNWQSVAAGYYHTVAVKSDGTLWAWGYNSTGQLGDGSTTDRPSPVQVGVGTNWQSVAAGGGHTVAVKSDGTLWAWGSNASGQLASVSRPVSLDAALGGQTIVSAAAGLGYSVAVKSGGTLWAWGSNDYGRLGDGSMTQRNSPVQVGVGTNWQSVAAGQYHTVAVKSDGTLWAWGYNANGRLGDGSTTTRTSPVQVGVGTNWQSVAAGYGHTVAVKSDGTLWAWGFNGNGQLGDGSTTQRTSPVQVGVGTNWQSVAAGYGHTVAVKSGGTLWAWGNNFYGQLGDGSTTQRTSPVQVGAGTNWQSVVAGYYHTVAVKSDGTLWARGYNSTGQLGDGSTTDRPSPVQVGVGTNWQSVAAGGGHTVAVKSDGTLWAWGGNASGQLGDGTVTQRTSPQQVGTARGWSLAKSGSSAAHTLATRGGRLWAFGDNSNSQVPGGDMGRIVPRLSVPARAAQSVTIPAFTATIGLPVALAATATSGLPISYAVRGPATLSGNSLTVTGPGEVILDAWQTGDDNVWQPSDPASVVVSPDLGVEQPVNTVLTDGVSSRNLGTVGVGGGSAAQTFTIRNTSEAGDLTTLAITKNGANAGDFTVNTTGMATTLSPGATTTFTVTFSPGASGARSAAIHIASNVAGAKNPFDIALTGTGITVLQNWRQTYYGTTSNTGNAADTADPYHTGIQNLAVFAFLGPTQNPTQALLTQLPQLQKDGVNVWFSFTEPAGVSGVTYGADLLLGPWSAIGDTGTGATHTFSVPIGTNTKMFLRLTVTNP